MEHSTAKDIVEACVFVSIALCGATFILMAFVDKWRFLKKLRSYDLELWRFVKGSSCWASISGFYFRLKITIPKLNEELRTEARALLRKIKLFLYCFGLGILLVVLFDFF